jgi:hypothetical protein
MSARRVLAFPLVATEELDALGSWKLVLALAGLGSFGPGDGAACLIRRPPWIFRPMPHGVGFFVEGRG